jgi:eukaryotic-like serine/threonine-protein kinase
MSGDIQSRYHFGEFELSPAEHSLKRGGKTIHLAPKEFKTLLLLAEQGGMIVEKGTFSQEVWDGAFVGDGSLARTISVLREHIGQDAIETVPRLGYRFALPVTKTEPADHPPVAASTAHQLSDQPQTKVSRLPGKRTIAAALSAITVLLLALLITWMAFYRSHRRPPEIVYTQLTDFTDSAVAPALSPDGRTVAFIRGSQSFLSSDQIYAKMLPDGEAKRLTDDNRPKYGLAFSPDGSQIAYTVLDLLDPPTFDAYTVSVLGGDSHLLMKNAAGLVWLDQNQLLFSQIRSGLHLGVVTATATRGGLREIYFPAHERGMAHYSYPSPDRHWALVVEMNGDGDWAQCRLVSLDGQHATKSIGPNGACTSAGWSPDGSWMYFTAYVEGHSHVWRQRFPDGLPEQITFGPTEEEGVAVEPAGQSLITSLGVYESAIWIHDPGGERPLSSEGEGEVLSPPTFSPDNSTLYYLLRRGQDDPRAELWRTSVDSGKSEAVFPGISMIAYDVSPDGKQVVYATAIPGRTTQLWLAPVDRSSSPVRVGKTGEVSPHFGAQGQILFQQTEGNSNYLEQMNLDGSNRSKVIPYPIIEIQSVSPARRWVIAFVPSPPDGRGLGVLAIPVEGGPPRRLCATGPAGWSTSGKFLFVELEQPSRTSPGRSLAIPVDSGEILPALPPAGLPPDADASVVKGSQLILRSGFVPGNDPSHFAYVNTTVHRNLYRISLP